VPHRCTTTLQIDVAIIPSGTGPCVIHRYRTLQKEQGNQHINVWTLSMPLCINNVTTVHNNRGSQSRQRVGPPYLAHTLKCRSCQNVLQSGQPETLAQTTCDLSKTSTPLVQTRGSLSQSGMLGVYLAGGETNNIGVVCDMRVTTSYSTALRQYPGGPLLLVPLLTVGWGQT
jgi:hypothetical protein